MSIIVQKCIVNEAEQFWLLKMQTTDQHMTKVKRLIFHNIVSGLLR